MSNPLHYQRQETSLTQVTNEAVGDYWRKQVISHPIRPGQNYQRNPLVSSTTRRQGQRGCRPFPLHPQSPPDLLRFASDHLSPGPSRLTKPNTSCTIITPASLRSDCCSPSFRNAVQLASGIDVHLHRNTHPYAMCYVLALHRPD